MKKPLAPNERIKLRGTFEADVTDLDAAFDVGGWPQVQQQIQTLMAQLGGKLEMEYRRLRLSSGKQRA